jgi:hypothetical protein
LSTCRLRRTFMATVLDNASSLSCDPRGDQRKPLDFSLTRHARFSWA